MASAVVFETDCFILSVTKRSIKEVGRKQRHLNAVKQCYKVCAS